MFRLLGFDVHVRPGFVVFLVLLVVLYGDEFGLWLAGALAVFTLVHELGHALAARRCGARASISLDFLAGYTSFAPTRPLSRGERALISVAGPAAHIASSVVVLAAMGLNPLDTSSVSGTAAGAAIWWAGPVIGVFNLIPVLPLDGGHIAQSGLERVLGPGAQRAMLWFSLAVTGTVAVWMALDPDRRFFVIFVGFLLLMQVQLLTATSARAGRPSSHGVDRQRSAAAEAERSAWTTGRPGMLVPGQQLSPWYRAHRARLAGRLDEARRILVDDLTQPGLPSWWPPEDANPADLRAVADLLPHPPPHGNPYSELVLADVLLRTGDPATAGHYAAAAHGRHRSAATALVVARAAAALGDRDTALSWLRESAQLSTSGPGLADAIATAPELAGLQTDPELRRLREALTRG